MTPARRAELRAVASACGPVSRRVWCVEMRYPGADWCAHRAEETEVGAQAYADEMRGAVLMMPDGDEHVPEWRVVPYVPKEEPPAGGEETGR